MIYWTTKALSFTATVFPLLLALTLLMFMKKNSPLILYNGTHYTASIPLHMHKIITLMTIGLELGGIIEWPWVNTIWPVWVNLCSLAFAALGGPVADYWVLSLISGRANSEELIANSWDLRAASASDSSITTLHQMSTQCPRSVFSWIYCRNLLVIRKTREWCGVFSS